MASEEMGLLETRAVKPLLRRALDVGEVSFREVHAKCRMGKHDLTTVDCASVLKSGVVDPGEWEGGSWRYKVRTSRICVVVAFRSETRVVIVTAWRIRQR